jgi:hypothetical protein
VNESKRNLGRYVRKTTICLKAKHVEDVISPHDFGTNAFNMCSPTGGFYGTGMNTGSEQKGTGGIVTK